MVSLKKIAHETDFKKATETDTILDQLYFRQTECDVTMFKI